ncbi:MAG: hypothetical protein QXG00_01820 [Candidatus Woesearchaeota archaeon]
MKKLFLALIIIILFINFLLNSVKAIKINEIMFNPVGADNNKEFVEIYGTNNVSGYVLCDSSSNDTPVLVQFINESNLSLIVEEGFNYSDLNCSIFTLGSTIGNNLDNDLDYVLLFYNNSLIDNLSYFDSENKFTSTEIINNNQYYFSDIGTPCTLRENSAELNKNESESNNNLNNNESIIENKSNISCNTSIKFEFPKKVYENNEQIKYYNKIIGNEKKIMKLLLDRRSLGKYY